jgi:CheY-like chemotaxis protein
MTVLLVEDDPIVRSTLADFLEAAGCILLEVENTLAALKLLADPTRGIEVLVTDINLGPGDDGLTLAAEARQRFPGLAIFYVTGSPERLAKRPPPSSERVFLKPFNPDDLVVAVLLAVETRRRGSRTSPAMTES